jgi:site-specific DNA-methyltransferase (adenine-specific)
MLLAQADARSIDALVAPGSAQLAYLDPPFAVGITFGARTRSRETRAAGPIAYDDRWPSLDAYLAWLEPRLRAVRACLAPRATMWLHLDQRAVHEAKVLADGVFGKGAFAGEIVWVPGNGTKARRGPGASHQTILIYATSEDYVWNARDPVLRAPFAKTSLAMHFKRTDDGGRAFRDRTVNGKTYRYYADEGRALGSVWTDCPAMVANTPLRKETTGYPTQKPLKLLDRIVRAASLPGGLVIDPFCGSGTTLEAAARLGRRFVGCDTGDLAIATSARRLRAAGIPFELRGTEPVRSAVDA